MNFSQRMGLEPTTKPFQINTMDRDLRNGLWNCFDLHVVGSFSVQDSRRIGHGSRFTPLWLDFFKHTHDEMPVTTEVMVGVVRKWFHNERETPWNRVYDFLEFVNNHLGLTNAECERYSEACNRILERESSAYRFVRRSLAPITNEA